MQMILALLAQVQILPFASISPPLGCRVVDLLSRRLGKLYICPGWPLQCNSSQLLAVFVLGMCSWGQTFSIFSKTNARNQQQLLHQHTDTSLFVFFSSQYYSTELCVQIPTAVHHTYFLSFHEAAILLTAGYPVTVSRETQDLRSCFLSSPRCCSPSKGSLNYTEVLRVLCSRCC